MCSFSMIGQKIKIRALLIFLPENLEKYRMAIDPPTECMSDLDRRLVVRKLLTSVVRRTEKLKLSLLQVRMKRARAG